MSIINLHPFQIEAKRQIIEAWGNGAKNVLLVIPTGGGKTVIFSDILSNTDAPSVAIAHRSEIVSQISLALARNATRHRIIGPPSVARVCTNLHLKELGKNYIDPTSRRAVAGVDTLIRMHKSDPWFQQVKLVVQDEAHHLTRKNKWGIAQGMFPNSKGLGVTATPIRADGCGLGSHADGVMDAMIVGPGMRQLIEQGYLSEYKIFAPASDLNLDDVPILASGDFSPKKLSIAVHKSHIVGNVVDHYLRIANGKLGVTFAVDIESAKEITKAFREKGVSCETVHAKTSDMERISILRRFRNREILQLVNVDLFGEGFDLPAIECVSMARPTQSYSLYAQQFGRALRPMEGKSHALIIDHVGNVHRHGLPDAPRKWSLDRREKRGRSSTEIVIPTRSCYECSAVFERIHKRCPYCGYLPEPSGRSKPEEVDGDLYELTPEALRALRGSIDPPLILPYSASPEIIGAVKKRYRERNESQQKLRAEMLKWGNKWISSGDTLSMAQRRFFHVFGIDVGTAQTLNRKDSDELNQRMQKC